MSLVAWESPQLFLPAVSSGCSAIPISDYSRRAVSVVFYRLPEKKISYHQNKMTDSVAASHTEDWGPARPPPKSKRQKFQKGDPYDFCQNLAIQGPAPSKMQKFRGRPPNLEASPSLDRFP